MDALLNLTSAMSESCQSSRTRRSQGRRRSRRADLQRAKASALCSAGGGAQKRALWETQIAVRSRGVRRGGADRGS